MVEVVDLDLATVVAVVEVEDLAIEVAVEVVVLVTEVVVVLVAVVVLAIVVAEAVIEVVAVVVPLEACLKTVVLPHSKVKKSPSKLCLLSRPFFFVCLFATTASFIVSYITFTMLLLSMFMTLCYAMK